MAARVEHPRYKDFEARSATGQGWAKVGDSVTEEEIDAAEIEAGERFQLSNDGMGDVTEFSEFNQIFDWDEIVGAALLDVGSLYVVEISFFVNYQVAQGSSFKAEVATPPLATEDLTFWEDTILLPRGNMPRTVPISIGIHLPITQDIADHSASLYITPDNDIAIWRNELLFYRVYKAADE